MSDPKPRVLAYDALPDQWIDIEGHGIPINAEDMPE